MSDSYPAKEKAIAIKELAEKLSKEGSGRFSALLLETVLPKQTAEEASKDSSDYSSKGPPLDANSKKRSQEIPKAKDQLRAFVRKALSNDLEGKELVRSESRRGWQRFWDFGRRESAQKPVNRLDELMVMWLQTCVLLEVVSHRIDLINTTPAKKTEEYMTSPEQLITELPIPSSVEMPCWPT
jgi:hypothetical protein